MTKIGWLIVFLFLIVVQVAAQTIENIEINVKKVPLSQVLFDLKETYGLQFAFDNDLLSGYKISMNRTFQSETEAISFLLKKLPLELEKSGDVFLILPKSDKPMEYSPIQISGQVLAVRTREPLPYSYILINQKSIQSDQQGHFNFIASADTSLNLQISHLGYFVYDTIVTKNLSKQFLLMPQIERIKEVQVLSNPIEKSTLIGDWAGRMKINHQIAPVLPGHGDNSVFNLLRLMPGVLAAGEQSNDLLIWGAYESHSKIQFDGITLFGLKNFNDNIATVNPFMVKNIEVMKGGYEARYGERVGSIVDIQGIDGTLQKPTFAFSINSTTINSLLEVPLSKKTSIIGAYRQTYYQLYDPTSIKWFRNKKNTTSSGNGQQAHALNFEVEPEFLFRDANLKYTYKGDNGSRIAISLYGGGDQFDYGMEAQIAKTIFLRKEQEENRQSGGSLQLSYPWQNGDATNITLSYSDFKRQLFESNSTKNTRTGVVNVTREMDAENTVNETLINVEHAKSFKQGHKLILGVGAIDNQVQLLRMVEDELVFDIDNKSPRVFGYLQDELSVGKQLGLKIGLRTNYHTELNRWYFEPRFSASLNITKELKINASWGMFNQFLSKTIVVDSSYNYTEFWTNSDVDIIPVLSGTHYVSGLLFTKKGFAFSTEVYHKTTTGLNRFFNGRNSDKRGFFEGKAKSTGIDIFLKQEYKTHMAWVSYSWSDTKEHFPVYLKNTWRPAPHYQEHEVKFAVLVNYKRFYLSGNYVYGSGFERYAIETADGTKLDQPYSRLDAALVYKFKPGIIKAEAGFSVLNIFNTENIKYSNVGINPIDEISLLGVYSNAISFTPSLFLKIQL